jgi:hypothetical protein
MGVLFGGLKPTAIQGAPLRGEEGKAFSLSAKVKFGIVTEIDQNR